MIAAIQPITGINAILTYAPIVFSQSGMSDPFKSTIWIGVVSVVANLGAFALVDRLGRRPVVLLGLLWCIVSLGACGWAFHHARYSFDEASLVITSYSIHYTKLYEDCPGEEHGLLRHDGDEPADRAHVEILHLLAVEKDAARLRAAEADQ